jgi:hypothetical protein
VVEAEVGETLSLKPYTSPYLSASSLPLSFGFTYGSYSDLSGVSIKGGHPKGNAVYINGVLINQPQSSYADLTDISPFLFGTIRVVDGGFSPYSFYGNMNFKPSRDKAFYGFLNNFLGFSVGFRDSIGGFDCGNLIGGRDTITFLEGMVFAGGFWNIRFSRKRTSGMEGFLQSSGIQTDIRILGKFKDFELLILGREWEDVFVKSQHTNLRLGRGFEFSKFRLLTYLEGIKSSNVGEKFRPILYISRDFRLYWGIISSNLWTDGKRIGYGSFLNFPLKVANFSFSLSNRIPSFDELYWKGAQAEGNPNLKNEKAITLTSDLNLKGFYLSVFFRRVWDLIEWRNHGGIWRPENVGGGRMWGASFEANFLGFKIKYDRIYAYYDSGKRMIYRPRNSYFASLSARNLELSLLYLDPRFSNPSNTRFLDFFLRIDGYLKFEIWGKGFLFGVENITNRKNYFIEGYPSRGRTFVFSVFGRI